MKPRLIRRAMMMRHQYAGYFLLLLFAIFLMLIRWLEPANEAPLPVEYSLLSKPSAPPKKTPPFIRESFRKRNRQNRSFRQTNAPLKVNTMGESDWQAIGFSQAQSAAIVHYRNARRGFRSRSEMEKCFVLGEAFWKCFEGKIDYDLPEQNKLSKSVSGKAFADTVKKNVKKTPVLVELNSADTSSLRMLRGIGPYWAYRICNYRQKLGGFLHPRQLLEIQGMDSTLYFSILPSLLTDSLFVDKIPINRVSAHRLQQHPYFRKNLAVALVNYRERHGPYKTPEELRRCLLVDPHIFRKIVPYLSFAD